MTDPIKVSELDEVLAADILSDDYILATHFDGVALKSVKAKITWFRNVVQTFMKAQRGGVVPLIDGASIDIDLSDGNYFEVTLGGNRALANPTGAVAGQSGIIAVRQDGVGGRLLSYASNWVFDGGAVPETTLDANAIDLMAYYSLSPTSVFITRSGSGVS